MNLDKIMNDKEFKKTIGINLAEESVRSYAESTEIFCEINNKTFEEMINKLREEQYDRIENNRVIRYDPNNGRINEYFNKLIEHYQVQDKSVNTINTRIGHVRTVLKKAGIQLPDKPKLQNNTTQAKIRIVSKAEISKILESADIWQKSYVTFLASTGMRVHDFCSLTIDDFIDATFDYHNCVDVDDFINEAPENMMGYWVFIPHKTKRIGLECRVCNTPESSNIILETLRIRRDRLTEKGKTLKGDDPLFISQNNGWNRKVLKKSLTGVFWRMNKKFQEDLKKDLEQKLKNKEISGKEYKKQLNTLPRFHPHGLRKFFTTTVRNYTTNRDMSLIMEGHTSPYKMDKHYVGVNDDLFSDESIKETYKKIIPHITFINEISSEEYQELLNVRDKYVEQLRMNNELREELTEMKKLITEALGKESAVKKFGLG